MHHTYEDLPTAVTVEMAVLFTLADFNRSGYIETDDFVRLVHMWVPGVMPLEVERIAIVAEVPIFDGTLSLDAESFFGLLCRLFPLLSQTKKVLDALETQSRQQLMLRQKLASEDEIVKAAIDQKALLNVPPPKREDDDNAAGRHVDDPRKAALADNLNAIRDAEVYCLRVVWAKSAVILTRRELEQLHQPREPSASSRRSRSLSGNLLSYPEKPKTYVKNVDIIANCFSLDDDELGAKLVPADSTAVIDVLVSYKSSLEATLLRAPFEYPDEIFGNVLHVYTDDQLEQFRAMFDVMSEKSGLLMPAHIQLLLELFTSSYGCDESEATQFLKDECDDIPGLTFELFLRYGGVLRDRVLAFPRFCALSNDKIRAQVIGERTEQLNPKVPLRRYERLFLKSYYDMRRKLDVDRHFPFAGTVLPPSARPPSSGKALVQYSFAVTGEKLAEASVLPVLRARLSSAISVAFSSARSAKQPSDTRKAPDEAVEWQGTHRLPRTARNVTSASSSVAIRKHLVSEKQVPLPSLPKPKLAPFDMLSHRKKQDRAIVDSLRGLYDL